MQAYRAQRYCWAHWRPQSRALACLQTAVQQHGDGCDQAEGQTPVEVLVSLLAEGRQQAGLPAEVDAEGQPLGQQAGRAAALLRF